MLFLSISEGDTPDSARTILATGDPQVIAGCGALIARRLVDHDTTQLVEALGRARDSGDLRGELEDLAGHEARP